MLTRFARSTSVPMDGSSPCLVRRRRSPSAAERYCVGSTPKPRNRAPMTSGEQPVAGGGYLCVLQPGRYTITARAEGYTPQSIVVDLEQGTDREIDFTMQPVP